MQPLEFEHSADELDISAFREEVERTLLIDEMRRRNVPQKEMNSDGTWPHTECIVCGELLPEVRLSHGFVLCVDCARDREVRRGRYAL